MLLGIDPDGSAAKAVGPSRQMHSRNEFSHEPEEP